MRANGLLAEVGRRVDEDIVAVVGHEDGWSHAAIVRVTGPTDAAVATHGRPAPQHRQSRFHFRAGANRGRRVRLLLLYVLIGR
jgi:hypothetical protein